MFRLIGLSLLVTGFLLTGRHAVSAHQYARCSPTEATLHFNVRGEETVEMDFAIRKLDDACNAPANFDETRPLSVKVRYDDKTYIVPDSCLDQIAFDLDGVEVQTDPKLGFLMIWFGPSLYRSKDIIKREERVVFVLFQQENFQECIRLARYFGED